MIVKRLSTLCKDVLAAQLVLLVLLFPVSAEISEKNDLYERLREADAAAAVRIERVIRNEWSKSGSAAMDLLLQNGRNALANGHTSEAIDHLSAVIDHAPDFVEVWNVRGAAFYRKGRLGPALSDLAEVLKRNPQHFEAITVLGTILEETGQGGNALSIYKKALEIHPHFKPALDGVKRITKEQEKVSL